MKLFVFAVLVLAFGSEAWSKSLKERSVEGTPSGVHRCEWEGRSYEEGAELPTRHLCLSCRCSEHFVAPDDQQCDVIQCPESADQLERGCIPTYNETECCPVAWNCDRAEQQPQQCDQRYFKHYLVKGCEPVYGEGGSECPAHFRCPPPSTTPTNTSGCQFQGKSFEIGQRIRTGNPCERCFCRQGWGDEGTDIVCVGVECGSAFRGPLNDSCYEVYEKDRCCPTRTQCAASNAVDLKSGDVGTTCVHGERTYFAGQRIYPEEDPCVVCTCAEGWTGDFRSDSNCRRHDCTLERKLRQLRRGCLPIYHEKTCCPIEFYCGENFENTTTPLATAEEIGSGNACVFRGGHYRIGQLLDIGHPTHCVTCRCSTPPDFTCVHRSCPHPPAGDNCVSTYVPGTCCPTYNCSVVEAVSRRSPSVQCSPVRCPSGCSEVTVHNSCPFCKCGDRLCAPPKCGPKCSLDATREGECPVCKCTEDDEAEPPSCSPVKCPDVSANCHQVTPPTGCPMCVCGPLCTPPNCSPGCQLRRDVGPGECPDCVCPTEGSLTPTIQCSPVKCQLGCVEVVGKGSCPSCNCSAHCAMPKCAPGCRLETLVAAGKCPGCVCDDKPPPVPCSPVKCGPLCHEAYDSVGGCPTCICDPSCATPMCENGCGLKYDPATGPCPRCVCSPSTRDRCPQLTCGPTCHQRAGSDGCPTCECGPQCAAPKCDGLGCHLEYDRMAGPCPACVCTAHLTLAPQCSIPKCDAGCTVDFSTEPCPSCACGGTAGVPGVQCSPPKCDAGCRIDYTAKPCPACTCVRRSAGRSAIQCSPPKCEGDCRIDHSAKPCPSCVCDGGVADLSGVMCSPPQCGGLCRVDYNAKPCPNCVCDAGTTGLDNIVCAPPHCEGLCRVDYNAKPCPSCVCDGGPAGLSGIQCSSPKCEGNCRIDYSAKPCPSCVCDGGPTDLSGIQCSPPKCDGICRVDYSAKPCPTCVCDGGPTGLSGIMCSPPKCDGNCRVDYNVKPCPSCVCDGSLVDLSGIQCSPPKCEGNCRIDYSAKPCPSCVCDGGASVLATIMCSPPKCEGTCRVDHNAKPCPNCVCDGGSADLPGVLCSPLKCDAGCRINYNARPCPSCECAGSSSDISGIMCSPPKCEGNCRVDYNAKPCPSCVCDGSPAGLSGIMCSSPKCDGNCRIDYSAKPCPSCVCDGSPTGLSGIMCSPPKCDGNCRVDYSAKPCPSCVCDGSPSGVSDILCSPPKCEAGCRIDYDTRPCPSCACAGVTQTETLQCSPPKCDPPCRMDFSAKPCPSCSCQEEGVSPLLQCSPPKCQPGCVIDYTATPCPSCKCASDGHALQCSPVHCAAGCQQAVGGDGCLFCRCGAEGGPLCTVPVCSPECRVDFNADPCPACVCDRFQKRQAAVFSDPFCARLKCGPGCTRAQTTSGPNERCPGCVCQGRSGEGATCAAMQCELPCRFKRFTPHGCPSCVCHAFMGGILPLSGK